MGICTNTLMLTQTHTNSITPPQHTYSRALSHTHKNLSGLFGRGIQKKISAKDLEEI